MAFKKILSMRLFNVSKFSSQNSLQNSRISTPSTAFKSLANSEHSVNDSIKDDGTFRRFLHARASHAPPGSASDVDSKRVNNAVEERRFLHARAAHAPPGRAWEGDSKNRVSDSVEDDGTFRRFLHARASHAPPGGACGLPQREELLEKLRGLDSVKERINLDGLRPPVTTDAPAVEKVEMAEVAETAEVRKLLRFSELENVKLKLREIERSCIGHGEFVDLCCTTSFGRNEGVEIAKLLDQSGVVIVLGDVVFIRPHQIMKAIQGLMPESVPHSRMKVELEQMERQKAAIDRKAKSLARRELGFGLGCLAIQTAVVMRLTFWELTWDVMEPICFSLTSFYFMAGYAFFLRTAKEPSFEGFFQSRFSTKQKRLMKLKNFDIERYNQLSRACYPDRFPGKENSMSLTSNFGDFHVPVVRQNSNPCYCCEIEFQYMKQF